MTNLVEQAREAAEDAAYLDYPDTTGLLRELADEIERLWNSFEPGAAHDIISRQSHEIERHRQMSIALNDEIKRLRRERDLLRRLLDGPRAAMFEYLKDHPDDL